MKVGRLYNIINQLHAKTYFQNVIHFTDPRMLINVCDPNQLTYLQFSDLFLCKSVKKKKQEKNYLRENRKEITLFIIKKCFLFQILTVLSL